MSMTFDLLKQRRLEKQSKNKYTSKKIESAILIELKENLDTYLMDNDRVMLEINPRFISEFMSALNDSIIHTYDFEQIESNKFVFSNKDLGL